MLPENSIFNDYTLLFNLKSNITFKAYMSVFESDKKLNESEGTKTM